jgi:hypothetical protein
MKFEDLDECAAPHAHDCHSPGSCVNTWGGYECGCGEEGVAGGRCHDNNNNAEGEPYP